MTSIDAMFVVGVALDILVNQFVEMRTKWLTALVFGSGRKISILTI